MRGKKRRKRGITPWKKTALRVCFLWLLIAAGLHLFRLYKVSGFLDQREAQRWSSDTRCAQVSAFLPAQNGLKEEQIRELEYKINTALAQDSIKLTAEGPDARLWQDCFSGLGNLTLKAGSKTVDVEAVGTGGAFFTFHPLKLSSGSYYSSDSLMKDEILLDEETAWKLFGAFDVEGRTLQVEDMHLRIAGVYKKEKGKIYEKAGLPEYVVFVQYKTLLQYGGGIGSDPGTAGTNISSSFNNTANTNTANTAGNAAPRTATTTVDVGDQSDTGDDSSTPGGSAGGSRPENTPNMENVGTTNTAYRDSGKITAYEIVMPDPVEGYAASVLLNALGEESCAVVVDNTNRFGERSLLGDLRDFAFLGMRTQPVRYPSWENLAMGWETIFAALFLLECLLIILTILLLLYMLVHWYRHKSWTLAGSFQSMQDSIYDKQSRKRYPEYYEETRREESLEDRRDEDRSKERDLPKEHSETGLLEDKGAIPFERIPKDRKAVEYADQEYKDSEQKKRRGE